MAYLEPFDALLKERPRTIRFRIVSLVALIIVPLIPLFVWMAVEIANSKKELIELQRFDIAKQVTAAIDQDISEHIGVLRGLAGSNDLKIKDFRAFEAHAELLASHPRIQVIWAFSRDGDFVAGTDENRVRDHALERLSDNVTVKVFAGRNFVSMVRGEGVSDASSLVIVPVFNKEKVLFGLAAEVRVGHLSRLFAELGMEPSWPAAVIDRSGNYVARSLDAENRLGKPAQPELGVAARGMKKTGIFENTTWEGVPVLNAFHRSDLTEWTSVVAVPKSELNAPLQRVVWVTLLGAMMILVLTILGASVMSSRISDPVRSLSRFANSLSGGKAYIEVGHRISELDEVYAALEMAFARSARLSALVASSGDAIVSIDLDGIIRTWNEGAEELLGYSDEEAIGRSKTLIVPENKLREYADLHAQVVDGESIRYETIRKAKDGREIDVSLNTAPIRSSNGKIIAISSIIHDITQRKAEEEHRHLLMRELAHRSKNQLAIIQSIATQSGRTSGSVDEFLEQFRQRLQGIAVSHDLLTFADWRGAPLTDVVTRQLALFVGEGSDRLVLTGPHVMLSASAAESIGLALHELATNSVKYGALSKPEGKVRVVWSLKQNGASPQLSLQWQEENGPLIKEQPNRKGFGSRIIETLVAHSVSGKATIEYLPEGVRWRLECELPTEKT